MLRKLLSLIIVFSLVLPIFAKTSFIYADDEDEYTESYDESEDDDDDYEPDYSKSDYERCTQDRDKEACKAYTSSAQSSLKEIEDQIENAKSDREAAVALANEYAQKAESYQGQIDSLKIQISELEERIEVLQKQIAENEEKVSALNERVKKRMVEAQKTMHFNGYLEFILGSKSFSDMLARVYGVEAIVSKDKADRETLLAVIAQLTADRQELDESKAQLDKDYEDVVAMQAEMIAMMEFYEEEQVRIDEELDAMTAERDNIFESFDDLRALLKTMGVTVNTGFQAAVHGSWISATVWNYDPDFLSGAWHLGVDYAASRGREIHAPAGGIIIRADDSCYDPGYLGSSCGAWISGGGNQVYLMCEVDGRVYGFIFFHLNSVYVSYGDYVLQDEVIGTVGSSGSSTGPHCHIEMYYLGYGDLADYLSMGWNATFSVGRGRTAYNNRCEAGNSPPCILNPEYYLPAN